MGPNGVDFHLSDEILAVIPTDPYDQLDLARKITSMAIASRVSSLESEAAKLRKKISDKDQTIAELQDQIAALDRMFRDSEARFRIALEENAKLMKERDMLAMASKKLGKDLSKLETFKRQLMQSLSDEKSSVISSNLQSIDNTTYDRPIARTSSWKEEESITRRASDLASISTEAGDPNLEGNNKFSITPYITPRLTPSATPTASSTVASPKGFSTAGSSPKMWSGSASPTKSRFERNYSSMSSWYTSTSSQQSSASSSPPGSFVSGRPPRIDGKEFFRQVRSRLSLEQFGAFLANIKELNAHRQSREETLEKAEEIFGPDNKDLYISFQRLLNRNLP